MTNIQSLHSILNSYGDQIELDYKFDTKETIQELKTLDTWQEVINNKSAINFNGPIDNLMKDKHSSDQEYNNNLYSCPSIKKFFDHFPDLAKCRAFKLDKGSYFAPHRDAWRYNEQFRIVVFLNKTEKEDFMFYLEDKFVYFKPGVPYILNTRKVHGSFCMSDDVYHIVMSLFLTKENMDAVMKLLPHINEH